MATDKNQLVLLIDFLKNISSQPGNDWFINELNTAFKINHNYPIESPKDNEAVNKIYEYCIKEIAKSQARAFYNDFQLSEIREQLVQDFVRMEHYRRQDDFENFCLAMFQQIENIVNFLISNPSVQYDILADKNKLIVFYYNKDTNKFDRPAQPSAGKLLFNYAKVDVIDNNYSKDINSWHFNNKLRAIILYFCFNGKLNSNTDNFERIYEMGHHLYQVRNQNHRGGIKTENQAKILETVLPNSNKYFLRFLGFLEEFVSGVNGSNRAKTLSQELPILKVS